MPIKEATNKPERRKGGGLWCHKLDKKLRSHPPLYRVNLPSDVIRIVVDILVAEKWTVARSLGLVNKDFRSWVLPTLYGVITVTSPAHLSQIRVVSTIVDNLTTHVRHISLVGLEMHSYGATDREGGLYKELEAFLSGCENLGSVLYDFKRVPLPFSRCPNTLKRIHWSHPSHDGWRGYEPALKYVTHLRVDCVQNARRNTPTFDSLVSLEPAFPNLTHLSFCIDPRYIMSTTTSVEYVRRLLERRSQLLHVVVMLMYFNPRRPTLRRMLNAYRAIDNPRLSLLVTSNGPNRWSSLTEWEDISRGGDDVWVRTNGRATLFQGHEAQLDVVED